MPFPSPPRNPCGCYTAGVSEGDPLVEEIRQLALTLAAIEDEQIRDGAARAAGEYKARLRMIDALDGVDRLSQEDILGVEERLQARIQRAREDLRDRLRA